MDQSALIIYRVDKGDPSNAGVIQKLSGQVEALITLGWDTDYIIHDGSNIYRNQEVIGTIPEWIGDIGAKWQFWKYLLSGLNKSYDLFLIRYSIMIPPQYDFIRSLRGDYPDSKIILDMPTYPYEDEWRGIRGRLGLYWDRKYRRKLSEVVDGITHSGSDKTIYDIKTITMTNGIATHLIRGQTISAKKNHTLTLTAVGKWQFWHGLDRLIRGLRNHLDQDTNREIHLHIVGDGPADASLRHLVSDLGLSSIVTFHGTLIRERLLSLLDSSDIAIGTLGLHRKGVEKDSSLKHRLYCARGIPMLLSSPDQAFDPQLPFVHYFRPDESDIDITTLIDWYDRLDMEKIPESMIAFAKNHLTWSIKMQQLLTAL